jgi:hypothetical protein
MSGRGLEDDCVRTRIEAWLRNDKSVVRAAEELGINTKTLGSTIYSAEGRRVAAELTQDDVPETGDIVLPIFADDDIPASRILDHMEARFRQRLEHANSLRWFEFSVKDTKPIGIMWFGDPHLGNNGCNIPLLRRDIEIAVSADGMYAANLGDTADNWGGKLMRLYGESDVSRKTERRLARWFLQDAGIPWILWLEGNHDQMDGAFTAYLRAINASVIPMMDWRAKFKIQFPNGAVCRVDAAHNHKGNSMWNELHGQERAAIMDETADLYIAGHHHDWGIKRKELPCGTVVTLARARGYKFIDSYAHRGNFVTMKRGSSIVTIIDPMADQAGRVHAFDDAAEASEFLKWKRKRAASS